MKTKLEVGKEYWLGEAKKYKGIYKGNFGSALYFEPTTWIPTYRDEQEHVPFIKDANGFIEFPLRGVFEVESWQFTTPIAMKCTEEQFNGIKDKLVEIGYKAIYIDFSPRYLYIVSNFLGKNNSITTVSNMVKERNERAVFESFNPDLFLALAAMTDKEDGIKGEWWMSTSDSSLLMPTELINLRNNWWRKATSQEIIEHFEKKEFVLQPRWYVELTESNRDIVIPWHKSIDKCSGRAYDIGSYYGIFESGAGDAWSSRELASQYQIITNDQFKKYVLKETEQPCQKGYSCDNIQKVWNELAKHISGNVVISIPPSKQATLFDDRVEITDWKPKEMKACYLVSIGKDGFFYRYLNYAGVHNFSLKNGFIKRTELEAKQLVEKLKQAML